VYRVELVIRDIVKDLPPLFGAFFENEKVRRCAECGALHPGKEVPEGWVKLPEPAPE
jgi:3-hydroxyanthranilate 3,4-dioxygenase